MYAVVNEFDPETVLFLGEEEDCLDYIRANYTDDLALVYVEKDGSLGRFATYILE